MAAGAGSSRALVRDVEWMSDILDAYVEASLAGDLHPSQEHFARNAHALQKAARKTGWRALVDEATGHQASRAQQEMERYFQRLFRFEASEWQRTFSRSFALALDKLHHGTWDGHGAYPRHLSNAFGFWTPDRIRHAELLADAGNMSLAADLCDAIQGDDEVQGALSTLVDALTALPLSSRLRVTVAGVDARSGRSKRTRTSGLRSPSASS